MRSFVNGALPILVALLAAAGAGAADLADLRGKKLIEYGWDVPNPAQLQAGQKAMEQRPFEGVIYRLNGGYNAFVTKPLAPAAFAEDQRILKSLRFERFNENFVLIWGSPPAGWDWFDDAQWKAVEGNARLLVRAARSGPLAGICFDPEPYDFDLWNYAKQPRASSRTFAEYRAQVRKRGAQLMRAFEKSLPAAVILTFFHVSLMGDLADVPEPERGKRLQERSWGLMPDFFVGMLEGASPGARFVDGNEMAYYTTTREQYFRAYHAIRSRARLLIPPELRTRYDRQVQVGMALYVDQNFALRQPDPESYTSYRMTPDERARWFEHNTYWALYTTDKYVWCYSERMNWWKNETPPGLEEAIVSARAKISNGAPLGFDIEPLLKEATSRPLPPK